MPQLLQWCTLSPQGASNLGAGAQPFKELPDVVSETEPEAFVLDIFFHVQYTGPTEQAAKRAANALVPTSIAFAGGQMDFTVDMGPEYATRLMIVKGHYDVVSLAVYGQVASEPAPVDSYEQKPLPVVQPLPLSKSIDPANSPEPKQLAEKLLSIISDPVSLPLVVRLMFCLKPADDDWEDPDFPHLYSDLEDNEADFDLEGVVSSMRRPIEDDIPADSDAFSKLADRVLDFIGPKSNDQAYHIAKLLNISGPQHPEMARTLLDKLDLLSIFDESTVDESIILSLLHACANRDVANHIASNDKLFEFFASLQTNSKFDQYTQAAAKRLITRIEGWQLFEECLVNKGDCAGAIKFLKDITSEENSVGIWVSCILLNEDLYSPLANRDDATGALPPPLFRNPSYTVNHGEFVTFVRALVGIICVLGVWAWADSLPNDMCRERTLGVINVWQSIEGYDNIVNHLLRLRQLTRRLGWIVADSDPPRKSGIFAERIVSKLADDPAACLQEAFIDTTLNLKQPLSVITEQDRLALRKNALVAEDGLAAAVEELLYTSERPFSLRRLRTLRVSIAIVQKEIEDEEGEWRVLNKFWEGDAHGIVGHLIDLLSDISGDVSKHFALSNVSRVDHVQVALLFNTANDLLRLIEVLSDGYPLTSMSLRTFAAAVADLFVCCDSADGSLAQTSAACAAAQTARQACLDVTHVLTGPAAFTEAGGLNAQVVLRTVLAHASSYGEHEPVHHFLQVYSLVDHILPYPNDDDQESEPSHWITTVLPKSLGELKTFFKLLDADSRLHMFRRLVRMDSGVIGVGEWLLTEELKGVMQVLQTLERPQLPDDYRLVLQYQVSASLNFVLDIVKPESTLSNWYQDALASDQDLVHLQIGVLTMVLDGCYTSPSLTRLVSALADKADGFDPDLRFIILLHLLRVAQLDPTMPGILNSFFPILENLPPESIDSERLRLQFGLTLSSLAQDTTSIQPETAGILLQTFEWALKQGDKRLSTLQGLRAEEFNSLCGVIANLNPEASAAIEEISSAITIDEDEVFAPSPVGLPSERQMQLSLGAIEGLLQPKDTKEDGSTIPRPSTPRAGNKTPDILGTIISPPTALLRSPAATGLTKTYANNDFRQLRQAPSARLNTSRLPSTHGTFPFVSPLPKTVLT
ncbi:hypothetical protein EST38_g405 [Candolleomyces aberdarensis]|uniref:Virilizer N-terminal domain-containing protein n=1 Tax=Candolleomyces aberdarensis TaxID=2316362 RepID=A0A4Q2E236_9AGAR|nr:hypothetical protein EST38_g405 [Candolleomyces aberdarensis]